MNISSNQKRTGNQLQQWQDTFSNTPNMFGESPSSAAIKAVETLKKEKKTNLLELGGGQGRDTIFFAQNGFNVQVLDYCQSGVESITQKAKTKDLSQLITAECYDIRKPLPFEKDSFDACYSHMLYCMELTNNKLEIISNEIKRVLKPGGLNIYTVRHTGDSHFGSGTHRGEDMYEVGGFVVHFFSKEKVYHLAKGYVVLDIEEFEEGHLPRKLFHVTLRKELN